MLYDNAQLARVYANAYQVTGNPLYRNVAEATLRYVQREMTSPEGGFYSTQDADSEGHEGKFFLWTTDEVTRLLGDDAALFMRVYDVTPHGNFEGKNILHLSHEIGDVANESGMDPLALAALLERSRATLAEARDKRVHPGLDDKIITAWNGLMLRAFVTGAAAFDDGSFLTTAERNATFLTTVMKRDGRVLRSYRNGVAKLAGYLEDYALLADGLLSLYEYTGSPGWFHEAHALVDLLVELFADPEGGPFFTTSIEHEQLINRPRDVYDNAVPAGNSVAAEVLLRVAELTGNVRYREHALRAVAPLQDAVVRAPLAFARLLCAADMAIEPPRELAIVGDPGAPDTHALLRVAWSRFDPNLVIGMASKKDAEATQSPLFEGRAQDHGTATAYVCERYTCQAPVTEPEALAVLLSS
jgi:uncharacterized protein YyaL (SSP411 family)